MMFNQCYSTVVLHKFLLHGALVFCGMIILWELLVPNCLYAENAILLDVHGDVRAVSEKGEEPAYTGQTSRGLKGVKNVSGSLSILFESGKSRSLKPGEQILFTVEDSKKSSSLHSKLGRALNGLFTRNSASERLVQGMTRNGEVEINSKSYAISELQPCNTAIRDSDSRFIWISEAIVGDFEISLRGVNPRFHESLKVPADHTWKEIAFEELKIKPSKVYRWKVRAKMKSDEKLKESESCKFSIVSREKIATLDRDVGELSKLSSLSEANRQVLQAALLADYQLFDEAISKLSENGMRKKHSALLERIFATRQKAF